MDSILGTVDKYLPGAKLQVKQLADKAKAYMQNMTDLEMKVMEATNHDPWGPHGTAMQEITNASLTSDGFQQIMGILDERMRETGENWRLVYKSLLLLEYMCKHGPTRIADALLSNRMHRLESLKESFEYKDPNGRDHGINVRQRAGTLIALITDRDRLNEERERAAKTSGKYGGVSSTQTRYGGFSGSSSSYSGGGGNTQYGGSSSSSYGAGAGGSSGRYGSGVDSGSFGPSSRPTAPVGAATASLDPVEATRQRIARLKAEGTLPDSPGSNGGAPPVGAGGDGFGAFEESGLVDTPKQQRAPKKLSEIKVNPAISAIFGKPGAFAPPAAGVSQRSGAAAGGSGGGANTAGSAIDLLGDLTVPAPTAPAQVASVANAANEWDAFSAAPMPAAATSSAAAASEWAAFESAAPSTASAFPAPQAQGQQAKPPVDLDSLLAIPGPSALGGPLPVDAFADFASAPAAAAPPLGGHVPQQPGRSTDPFAASTMTPAMAHGAGITAHTQQTQQHQQHQQHQQQNKPKLGPETARAKDPFADLAGF